MSREHPERTVGDTGMLTTNAGGHLVLRKVRVAVIEGPDTGLAIEIDGGTRTVGTGAGMDLRLTDPKVSRAHLEIALLPRGVSIRDLESRNGTFVGDAIVQRLVLPAGGLVKLGKTTTVEIVPSDVPLATPARTRFGDLVAASPAMTHVLGVLARVAQSDLPVLLEGEDGVGKTAAARALHAESGRSGEIVVFDLSTEQGADELDAAFAASARGTLLIERVDRGGTSLLTALIAALGALETDPRSPRIVATSRENVRRLIEEGAFPRDLYFHLAALHLVIPPLRERPEDVAVLAEVMRARHGSVLSDRALAELRREGFPGNVRALRAAPALATTPATNPDDEEAGATPAYKEARDRVVGQFEREYLERLLTEHRGNVSKAARAAGMARSHLIDLLKKHGLDKTGP